VSMDRLHIVKNLLNNLGDDEAVLFADVVHPNARGATSGLLHS
jgi:hypothetical protein